MAEQKDRKYWNLRCVKCERNYQQAPVTSLRVRYGGGYSGAFSLCLECIGKVIGVEMMELPMFSRIKESVQRPGERRQRLEFNDDKARKEAAAATQGGGNEVEIGPSGDAKPRQRPKTIEPNIEPPEDGMFVYTLARGLKIGKKDLLGLLEENGIKVKGTNPNEHVLRKFAEDIKEIVEAHKSAPKEETKAEPEPEPEEEPKPKKESKKAKAEKAEATK